ncbi:unnamed protein product [Cuscuta campestris]|uniref:Uncharacterized protein n=1 Tax=Cuscuta campestris TaxID=132261 RepID=A0A484MSK3_9ASTE|nr:unnamed protein product [Cuscuta campestris]
MTSIHTFFSSSQISAASTAVAAALLFELRAQMGKANSGSPFYFRSIRKKGTQEQSSPSSCRKPHMGLGFERCTSPTIRSC